MKTIKYRAWLKEQKEMVEVAEISFENETIAYVYDNYAAEEQEWNVYDFEEIELMQYAGLKDKNGVEIYEGDYIRFTDFDSNQGYEGEVAFKGGAFCMLHKIEGAKRSVIMATMLDVDGYIEVIGNIYENKELLEKKESGK